MAQRNGKVKKKRARYVFISSIVRANLLQAPTRTLNDLVVNSYGLAECLDKVERASGWRKRLGKLPPGKGLGMACSHYVSGAAKPIQNRVRIWRMCNCRAIDC